MFIQKLIHLSTIGLVTCGLTAQAMAQQDDKKMSAEQIELLNQANRELVKDTPDLAAAEKLMQTALERGLRFDLLLLTQGRILQKQDRCEEAKKLFGEINVAPHEPSQKIEDIKRIKNQYIEQMPSICSASLELTCTDPDTQLTLGAQEVLCGQTVKVTPGIYQIQATLGETREGDTLELKGAEKRTYRVGLVRATEPPKDNTQQPVKPDVKPVVKPVVPSSRPRYRKTLISGISTLALTGLSAVTWGVASAQQDSALDGFLNDDGTWRADNDLKEQEEAEKSANAWGTAEVIGGFGVPIVAGVGAIVTTIFWFRESRAARMEATPQEADVSWQIGLTRDSAHTGVLITW